MEGAEMVQPINYGIQVPSAFESLVSGLKLGTSLQEMQAQREQRALQAQAMQQKMEAERQRQEVLRDFYGKAKAEQPLTVADWLRFGEASGSAEYQKLASAQIQAMPEAQQQANAGFMGQTIAALYKSPEIGLQLLRDRVAANPQDKGLQAIFQTAETNPKAAAVSMYGMMSGLGGKFADVAKNVADMLGMKETAPTELPEKAKLAQWYQTATPEQKQAYNQLFPPEVRSLTEAQQLEWYKNLPEADKALFDQMRSAGKTPLVQNVLPGQPAPPTAFEEEVNKKGAQIYVSWALEGGAANATARIAALENEVKKLEASATGKGPTLSGVQIQVIPEALRPLLVPAAQEARQNAERVIQEGLRPILGAQFTKDEGERFLARAFDPALGADRNARRLRLILEQMKASAKQAQSVSDYVEKNKSLIGFKGVYPSLAQFEAVLAKDSPPEREGQPAAQTAPTAPAASVRRREIAPGVFVTERQ